MRAADHHPRRLEEAPLLLSETAMAFYLGLSVLSFRRNRGALHASGMPQPLASLGAARPRSFWSRPAIEAWLAQDERAAPARGGASAGKADVYDESATCALLAKRAKELLE